MKKEDLIHAMNDIKDEYIEEADTSTASGSENSLHDQSITSAFRTDTTAEQKITDISQAPSKKRRFSRRAIGGIIAACFVGVFAVGILSQAAFFRMGSSNSEASAGAYESAAEAGAYEDTDYAWADTEEAYIEDAYDEESSGYSSFGSDDSSDLNSSDNTSEASGAQGTIDTQKLVYTAYLTIQTKEYTDSRDAIREQIRQLGGFIESESESDSNYSWYYSDYSSNDRGYMKWEITIRIPSENYETFMNGVGDVGKVLSKTSNVENITKRYNNTQTRIESLETQLSNLQSMMEQAETIEDMITIESRMSEVTYELNSYRTDLSDMDTDVAYSTIHLSLEEVAAYTKTEAPRSTFGERLLDTIEDSILVFVDGMETILFLLIYLLPFAIVILIIVLIIRALLRRRKKNKAKK